MSGVTLTAITTRDTWGVCLETCVNCLFLSQATQGGGGWPMSVFLTPELKPFIGGTYFPPQDSFGRPGFATILQSIAKQVCLVHWRTIPEYSCVLHRRAPATLLSSGSWFDSKLTASPKLEGDWKILTSLIPKAFWIDLGIKPILFACWLQNNVSSLFTSSSGIPTVIRSPTRALRYWRQSPRQ